MKENQIDTQQLSRSTIESSSTSIKMEHSSDGLAWTLLIITSALLIVMIFTVVAMCCYMRSQKK